MKKRIVVTGLGAVSSIGIGKDAFWRNLIEGKSGISKVESFDTTDQPTHNGGEIKNFKTQNFIHPRKIPLMGRASHLGIAAAKLALSDAGFDSANIPYHTAAVVIGTTMGEIAELEAMDKCWIKDGYEKVASRPVLRYSPNNIPANIAAEFNFTGPNIIFSTACAAGNYAVGYGYDLLSLGKADAAIAGGVDGFSYISFTGFNQLAAVAPERCQPFDKNRKGMMPGEGAGMLVLETQGSANARGARIYAEILGYGLSCDAFHMTNPQADGIAGCMIKALKEAQITPGDVDYISAHGTGTRHNDRTECAAINRVFGGRRIPVSSIKSMLGHTMGAATALEAIACCCAVQEDIVPPTINFETPDPECDVDCVPNASRAMPVRIALNNGFAFGGNNSCLVLGKYQEG